MKPRTATRLLTFAQLIRLDGLASIDGDARVVGWCAVSDGPIVRYGGGGRRVVKPDGRLRIVGRGATR